MELKKKLTDYEDFMDYQFELLQKVIDLSNDAIHQDYEDIELLETGIELLEEMVETNKVNYQLVDQFPSKKEVKFIIEQYQAHKLKPLSKIREEVKSLEAHLEEVKEAKEEYEDMDEELRAEAMNTVQRIATYNLQEYEDTLESTFKSV